MLVSVHLFMSNVICIILFLYFCINMSIEILWKCTIRISRGLSGWGYAKKKSIGKEKKTTGESQFSLICSLNLFGNTG